MTVAEPLPPEFVVKVIPRASRNEVVGWTAGTLKIRLTAPPVDGRANAALVEFLSDEFDLPKSRIFIIRGQSARTKRIRISPR